MEIIFKHKSWHQLHTDQSEELKKEIFIEQENVLNNAKIFLEKRGELIDQFTKNNIISRN